MEPSFEQEPAEKQHQTTCAPVSENGPVPGLHVSSSTQLEPEANHQQVFSTLIVSDHIFNEQGMQLNQTVPLRSGMLEQGVDRIVAQVVDPKVNHIFRPQVERVVREFLSPGSCSEEPPAPPPLTESKPESSSLEQGTQHVLPCVVKQLFIIKLIQEINYFSYLASHQIVRERVPGLHSFLPQSKDM